MPGETDLVEDRRFPENPATFPHASSLAGPHVPAASRPLLTRLLDRTVYVAVRVLICVVQSLPRSTCERFARNWSDFLANRVKIRRRVVRDNLRMAFPDWSSAQCRDVACGMWEHLLLMVIEIAHAPRVIHKTTWRRHLRIDGMEEMVRTLWLDRPKVILSGHFGNFELAAYLFGLFGFRIFSVARELDNPLLDEFVTRFRESRGQRILPKKGSGPDVAIVLEENGAIGLLGDQAAGPKGCWVDFFGRPASVHKAIGVFALSSQAPIIVCSATRRGGRLFDYDLRLEGTADPATGGAETADLRAVSQWYTNLLERAIRRAPSQYWWVHRRWRGQPAAATVSRSAA
jgi:KDO2-lipid IV(A) lauroyltransferase